MSQRNERPDYLLLFRGSTWESALSPAELKQVVTAWSAGCIVEVRPVGEQNVARVAGLECLEEIAKAVTTKA